MANTKSDKEWAGAVRKAVYEYRTEKSPDGKVKKLRWLNVLAAQLVRSASDGDMTAMKEIGDRLDGKPSQGLEHSGGIELKGIERVIRDPKD